MAQVNLRLLEDPHLLHCCTELSSALPSFIIIFIFAREHPPRRLNRRRCDAHIVVSRCACLPPASVCCVR